MSATSDKYENIGTAPTAANGGWDLHNKQNDAIDS